jgi:DNA-binding NtrC family response regulator
VLERLRDSVRGSAYSAAARRVFVQLERLGRARVDVALAVPLGVDVLSWVSVLHLASPVANGPLAVVDAVDSGFESARSWQGRGSALERAAGGTLLVLNANALSPIAQDTLAIALAERNPTGDSPPPPVVLALREPLGLALEQRRFSRALAQFFTANVLDLPELHERPEDLRALVLRTLTESGVHSAGDPLGLEPEALRLLVEYEWPGNELELRHIVGRAAQLATPPRVSLADLAAAGFVPALEEPSPASVASVPGAASGGRASSSPRRRRRR